MWHRSPPLSPVGTFVQLYPSPLAEGILLLFVHYLIACITQNIMADPTAFYEPEEDELLSSLAVPAYQDHEEEYRRLQELEQHAYAQQIAAAQEAEIEQGLELVPEDVKKVRFER